MRIIEPVFESQTKTKLGSATIEPGGESLRTFIGNFLKTNLDNYLHKHPQVAEAIQKRIISAERERKDLKGIQKLAREQMESIPGHQVPGWIAVNPSELSAKCVSMPTSDQIPFDVNTNLIVEFYR